MTEPSALVLIALFIGSSLRLAMPMMLGAIGVRLHRHVRL